MILSSGTSYRTKWNSRSAVAELAFRLSVICRWNPHGIDADGGDSGEEAEPRHAVQGDADVPAAFEECEG